MIVKTKEDKNLCFHKCHLCGEELNVISVAKYLGHFMSDDLSDDTDIRRQCRKLYAQGNTLARKFHRCSPDVKATLFRTYCTALYTAQLWCNYRK